MVPVAAVGRLSCKPVDAGVLAAVLVTVVGAPPLSCTGRLCATVVVVAGARDFAVSREALVLALTSGLLLIPANPPRPMLPPAAGALTLPPNLRPDCWVAPEVVGGIPDTRPNGVDEAVLRLS